MSPKYLAIIFFFLMVIGYTTYQLSGLVQAPQLIIETPPEGGLVTNDLIIIHGRGRGLTKLVMNDETLILDQTGGFETKLLLARGYNIINFSGLDHFGRMIKKQWPVIYQSTNNQSS